MSKGINKVFILGNVGNVDVKSKDSFKVANLSIATNESWKDKEGQFQTRTEWHRCVCFGKLADIVDSFVKKGSKLHIEGKLQTRKWKDKEGRDNYTTEIIVSDLVFLDNKEKESEPVSEEPDFTDEIPF